MFLNLYRWFSVIAGPFIDLYLMYRLKKGKEDPARYHERLGKPSQLRPQGPLLWIHGASVGEALSVLPLLHHVLDSNPRLHVLMTTGTVASSQLLRERLPDRAIHQYVPIDKLLTVQRFLDYWRPDMAMFIESELWPNLIMETHRRGCPMVQVNARMSLNSMKKWQRYKDVGRRMLSCFTLSLAQSEEDKERLQQCGAPNVQCLGNLKFDAPALPADPKETGQLVGMIGERPLWLAASTHPGEEEVIISAHKTLKEQFDTILTIIIPRHSSRGNSIAEAVSMRGLKSTLRSKNEPITENTDIYIADTMGELGLFYRLVGIVFMGGSLVEHGGQNPLEAARLDCAILTGPHTQNFTQVYSEMETQNAVVRIGNAETLATQVGQLLSDHDKQESLSGTALELVQSKKGVVDAYLQALSPYLKPLS